MKETKQRTSLQNKSLHKWLTEMATALNEAGYTQRRLLEVLALDIPNTKESLKELFRPVILAMYNKESTSDLTTIELQEAAKVFDLSISQSTGVHVEWPTNEERP